MKILELNECELPCSCGWNITIGGTSETELKKLKEFLEPQKPSDLHAYYKDIITQIHNDKLTKERLVDRIGWFFDGMTAENICDMKWIEDLADAIMREI